MALLTVVSARTSQGRAQTSPIAADADEVARAAAEPHFARGLELMATGACQSDRPEALTCRQAITEFAQAYSLYPLGLGALRNRAFIEQRLGLTASASLSFEQLARAAERHPDPRRREWAVLALAESERLRPRIPQLRVTTPQGVTALLFVDGEQRNGAAESFDLRLDPGRHRIVVRLAGRPEQSFDVSLAEGERYTLAVAERRTDAVAPHGSPVLPPTRSPASRLLPWSTLALGGVGVTVGLGLGYLAADRHAELCDENNRCRRDGFEEGKQLARASTIVTVAGGAVLAAGVTWVALTSAHDRNSARPRLAVRLATRPSALGLQLAGAL